MSSVRPQVPAPPTFDGKPNFVKEWLFSTELYFGACQLDFEDDDSEYCATLAASFLRGNALAFYRMQCTRDSANAPRTWDALKSSLENQFGSKSDERDARDKLRSVVQKTSVSAYMLAFQDVVLRIEGITEAELLHAFTYGLKPYIRHEVRMRHPTTIQEASSYALDIDECGRVDRTFGNQQWRMQQGPKQPHFTQPTQQHRGFLPQQQGPVPMELGGAHGVGQPRQGGNGKNKRPQGRANVVCYRCGKVGHMRRDCRVNLNKNRGNSAPQCSAMQGASTSVTPAAVNSVSGGQEDLHKQIADLRSQLATVVNVLAGQAKPLNQ